MMCVCVCVSSKKIIQKKVESKTDEAMCRWMTKGINYYPPLLLCSSCVFTKIDYVCVVNKKKAEEEKKKS